MQILTKLRQSKVTSSIRSITNTIMYLVVWAHCILALLSCERPVYIKDA